MATLRELYDLVNSMTKSEKRYFKLHTDSQGSNKKYLKLYECLEKLNVYDEQLIRAKFSGSNFIGRLSVVQSYLFEQILASLQLYESSTTIEFQINNLIWHADLLHQKGLDQSAIKLINKAKNLAIKYENLISLLNIIKWERKLADKTDNPELPDNLHKVESDILKKLDIIRELDTIHAKIIMLQSKTHNPEILTTMNELVSLPVMKQETELMTDYARYRFHRTYSIFYRSSGNAKQSERHREKTIAILDNNRLLAEENPEYYFASLTGVLFGAYDSRNFKRFFEVIWKIRNLPELSPVFRKERMSISIFLYTYGLELRAFLSFGETKKCIELIKLHEKFLHTHSGKIDDEILEVSYFHFASVYFGMAEYSQALYWMNELLNYKQKTRTDVFIHAQLFNLLIHFELDNIELIESLVKGLEKSLPKQGYVYQWQKEMLRLMKKLIRTKSRKEQLPVFEKSLEKLEQIQANDPKEQKVLRNFRLTMWIMSKISGKSYNDLYLESIDKTEKEEFLTYAGKLNIQ